VSCVFGASDPNPHEELILGCPCFEKENTLVNETIEKTKNQKL
jgi:hypothetical protein